MKGRRREHQKQETRRLLLDTAYELFLEKGYDKTTIKELAERAGVAQGTIFKHFQDKTALIVAAMDTDMRAVEEACFESIPDTDLKSQLVYITRQFYGFYKPKPALGNILIRQALLFKGESAEFTEGIVKRILGRVSELIRAAVDRGELRKDVKIENAASAFWAFYMYGLLSGLGKEDFQLDAMVAIVENMLNILFAGLTP